VSQTSERSASSSNVNFDEAPIVQAEIDGVDYRVDTGMGSTVAISTRPEGTWLWTVLTEAKWDGLRLRTKALDHAAVSVLERALSNAMRDASDGG
jgi:hypothetical protein